MSKARSATTGLGSMASHGSRSAARTLPRWKSWWQTTSSGCDGGSSTSAATTSSSSPRSKGRPAASQRSGRSRAQRAAVAAIGVNGPSAGAARDHSFGRTAAASA